MHTFGTMDTLSLKEYHWQNDHLGIKRNFLEFFINDRPLSGLVDDFYGKGNILNNWAGVLGAADNKQYEIIKLKQLLEKKITDSEIRKVFPASWTEEEFEPYLDQYHEELSNPEIVIYRCGECGGYNCGGITAKISHMGSSVLWTLTDEQKVLTFEFDKYLYFAIFNERMKYLKKE